MCPESDEPETMRPEQPEKGEPEQFDTMESRSDADQDVMPDEHGSDRPEGELSERSDGT